MTVVATSQVAIPEAWPCREHEAAFQVLPWERLVILAAACPRCRLRLPQGGGDA